MRSARNANMDNWLSQQHNYAVLMRDKRYSIDASTRNVDTSSQFIPKPTLTNHAQRHRYHCLQLEHAILHKSLSNSYQSPFALRSPSALSPPVDTRVYGVQVCAFQSVRCLHHPDNVHLRLDRDSLSATAKDGSVLCAHVNAMRTVCNFFKPIVDILHKRMLFYTHLSHIRDLFLVHGTLMYFPHFYPNCVRFVFNDLIHTTGMMILLHVNLRPEDRILFSVCI